MMKKIILTVVVVIIAIQFVPYGRNHSNPPVTAEPPWDSPKTRETFFRACSDCHSNATQWPWYNNIAPASWLIQSDVNEGRSRFNVSEWKGKGQDDSDEAAKMVEKKEMPPWFYLPAHPKAWLSADDRKEFVKGLAATFGGNK